MAATDPMTPAQAIALAALLLDFEAENSDVRTWRNECMSAARTLRSVASAPPSEWVQRDDRSLNHSNYNF